MIQQRLQQWILHPESLNEDSLFELRELLERFPYFQTARLLYLKNLFLLKDASFKDELKNSVLYIADLSQLFYFIEGDCFVIEKHKSISDIEKTPQNVDRTLALIDRFLSDSSDDTGDAILPVESEVSMDYTSILLQQEQEGETEPIVPLRGQDLIDSFLESSAASSSGVLCREEQELYLGGIDGACQKEGLSSVAESELSGQKVDDEQKVLEKDEEEIDEDYFTETLAKIYVKQQRYEKALEIIKKLNLKYPKKNAYFADQIRFLEKLIINAKSK